jgi:hypothetical protein
MLFKVIDTSWQKDSNGHRIDVVDFVKRVRKLTNISLVDAKRFADSEIAISFTEDNIETLKREYRHMIFSYEYDVSKAYPISILKEDIERRLINIENEVSSLKETIRRFDDNLRKI